MADEPKPDPNEPRVIEAIVGPYAGQRLTVPPADADAAINDGWAKDPFAPPPPPEDPSKPPKEEKQLSEEERTKILEAAHKAANKLRGHDEKHDEHVEHGDDKHKHDEEHDARKRAAETRDMKPDEGGTYETKAPPPSKPTPRK